MRSRKQILQKLKQFYGDVQSKIKSQNTRLQVDNEFQQIKIKDLNDKYNVIMFTTSLRGGKAFAKELKSRISKVKALLDKTLFNFKRIEQSKKISDRLDKYDQSIYAAKKRKYGKV